MAAVTDPAIERLARICRRWRGDLRLLPRGEFEAMRFQSYPDIRTRSPDGHHGLDFAARAVFARDDRADAGAIVHEMGHLFLREADLANDDEFPWIGWEIALARRTGCYSVWSAQNAEYQIGDFDQFISATWAELSSEQQARLSRERIAHAKSLGIVSARGVPLATR